MVTANKLGKIRVRDTGTVRYIASYTSTEIECNCEKTVFLISDILYYVDEP